MKQIVEVIGFIELLRVHRTAAMHHGDKDMSRLVEDMLPVIAALSTLAKHCLFQLLTETREEIPERICVCNTEYGREHQPCSSRERGRSHPYVDKGSTVGVQKAVAYEARARINTNRHLVFQHRASKTF
jgi:hypothetical protein